MEPTSQTAQDVLIGLHMSILSLEIKPKVKAMQQEISDLNLSHYLIRIIQGYFTIVHVVFPFLKQHLFPFTLIGCATGNDQNTINGVDPRTSADPFHKSLRINEV